MALLVKEIVNFDAHPLALWHLGTNGLKREFAFVHAEAQYARAHHRDQSWALSVFFHFFNNKKWFFCTFYQVDNLFLHQSYLKSPLPVKLTR